MRQMYRGLFMAGALAFAQDIWALGLGTPLVSSHLNEPLKARIALLDTQGVNPDEVRVALSSDDAFNEAKLARSAAVDTLRVNIRKQDKQLEIVLEGTRPLREPYLELMLDVAWPHGQLRRQVTLLLDPPTNDVHQNREEQASFIQHPATPLPALAVRQHIETQRDATRPNLERSEQAVSIPKGNVSDVEVAVLAQRMERLEAKLDALTRQDNDSSVSADQSPTPELTIPFADLEQAQQRLNGQLNELITQQRLLDERFDQLVQQKAIEAPLSVRSEEQLSSTSPRHRLWQAVIAWLSPITIISAGGLLVVVGLLLVRHQRARHDDMLAMELHDPALDEDTEALESNEPDKASMKGETSGGQITNEDITLSAMGHAASHLDISHDVMTMEQSVIDHPAGFSAAVKSANGSDSIGDSVLVVYEDIEPETALAELQKVNGSTHKAHRSSPAFDESGTDAITNMPVSSALDVSHSAYPIDAMKVDDISLAAENTVKQEVAPDQEMGKHEIGLSFEPGPFGMSPITSELSNRAGQPSLFQTDDASSSFDVTVLDEPLTFTTNSDAAAFQQGFNNHTVSDDAIEKAVFPAHWSFEEVAFEALGQDNNAPDEDPAHDERLIHAHVMLDAGNTDAALILLRQIEDEGPDAVREAARLLINRFDVPHSD